MYNEDIYNSESKDSIIYVFICLNKTPQMHFNKSMYIQHRIFFMVTISNRNFKKNLIYLIFYE